MPLQYVLSPMAEEDLEDIWTYTVREWSVDQAETYTNDIINMFEDIAAGKRDGRPVLVRAGYLKTLVGRHTGLFPSPWRSDRRHQNSPSEHGCRTAFVGKGMSASAGCTAAIKVADACPVRAGHVTARVKPRAASICHGTSWLKVGTHSPETMPHTSHRRDGHI